MIRNFFREILHMITGRAGGELSYHGRCKGWWCRGEVDRLMPKVRIYVYKQGGNWLASTQIWTEIVEPIPMKHSHGLREGENLISSKKWLKIVGESK